MTDGFVKMETENFKFFQHKACEFFPCHETKDIDNFNCLFCYCPLYAKTAAGILRFSRME